MDRARSTRTTSTRPTIPTRIATYFAAATRAALVLAAFRAPYRGRSTPVNAWWGSFDLAVNLFSGLPADPPSDDFIMRNSMDAQEVAVGLVARRPALRRRGVLRLRAPADRGLRRRDALARSRSLGRRPRPLRARLGRRPGHRRPTRRGARLRAVGVRACLHGLRLGPGAARERRGDPAARGVGRGAGSGVGDAAQQCERAHQQLALALVEARGPACGSASPRARARVDCRVSSPAGVSSTKARRASPGSGRRDTRPASSSSRTVCAIDCGRIRSAAARSLMLAGPSRSRRPSTASWPTGGPGSARSRRTRRPTVSRSSWATSAVVGCVALMGVSVARDRQATCTGSL